MPTREHVSPDGVLRLSVENEGPDRLVSLGPYPWHIHSDQLATMYNADEESAIDRLMADITENRIVLVVVRAGGAIRDVWITDEPVAEEPYKLADEEFELRYWDGTPWRPPAP